MFNANTNAAPEAGQYTVILPGDISATASPAGDSYGMLSVDKAGRIHFAGSLSDNTKISQTVFVSRDGNWPFYVPLYGGQGAISGWLNFTSALSSTGGITGDVFWFKPTVANAKYYPDGFNVSATVLGSNYQPPPAGSSILNLSNATLTFSGGDLAQSVVNPISLDAQSRVTNLGANALNLTFSLANGSFIGSVTDPNSSQQFPFKGVVLQNGNSASGYFLGPTQSGEVELEAPQ